MPELEQQDIRFTLCRGKGKKDVHVSGGCGGAGVGWTCSVSQCSVNDREGDGDGDD